MNNFKNKILIYSLHNHDYLKFLIKDLKKITNVKIVRFRNLLKYFFKKDKFILHIQFPIKYYEFFIILLLSKLRKIPVVWTPHDLKSLHRNKKYPFFKFFLKIVNKIIVLSEANKKELITKNIDNQKIEVVPIANFIFYAKYKISQEKARNELGIDNNKIVFLQFGPFRHYKGYNLSIQAYKSLPDNFKKKSELVFAGKKWENDNPKNVNLNGINIKYLWDRYLNKKEVGLVFSAADVILYPYLWITQSGSIYLSFAFGKPCIASNLGGIPEVIKHNQEGFLIKPEVAELKKAMIKFIENPRLIEEMGNNSFTRGKRDSWKKIAKLHLDIYGNIKL